MTFDKYDIALAGIGVLIAVMIVSYLTIGITALIVVSILSVSVVGHALFGMGVGQQSVKS